MSMTLEEITPVIKGAARKVTFDYPEVEYEDLTQELYLTFLQYQDTIRSEDEGGNPSALFNKIARQIASRIRTESLRATSQYNYRPSDLRRILETVYNQEMWPHAVVPEDAISIKGNDPIEISSDVAAALDRLPDVYRQAIEKRYKFGEVPTNGTYERKRLNLAISALADTLNSYRGYDTGPGSRRVVSNATAQVMIRMNVDGA